MDRHPLLRNATANDATSIAAIYQPIVTNTPISFEAIPPTGYEIQKRIQKAMDKHLWLVCETDDVIWGYAYAGPHRSRVAYQWATEVSVYIGANFRKRNVGKALYTLLLGSLRLQGFLVALAGITLPNEASVAFHESMGFQTFAQYDNIGYKLGQWHSTIWMRKELAPFQENPAEPVACQHLVGNPTWKRLVENATKLIRI